MFFKKLAAVSVGAALGLSALAVIPAQAAPLDCDDEGAWSWSVTNPARYINTGAHEAVIGLSDAKRKVTVKAPSGCVVAAGTEWRLSNGYLSAEGTFSADEATAKADSDTVFVEKPSSNAVAGDELSIRLRVNLAPAAGWEVDTNDSDDSAKLVLLRRAEFKYKSTANRVNFGPEPYVIDVKASGNLLRASWSAGKYAGYEGRNVHIQARPDVVAPAPSEYTDAGVTTTGVGGKVDFTFAPTINFIGRGLYNGNDTTGGTVSIGDRVLKAS